MSSDGLVLETAINVARDGCIAANNDLYASLFTPMVANIQTIYGLPKN
jgi:hypothetical protein